MKIICKSCNSEIDLAPFSEIETEKRFVCDSCGVPVLIRKKVGYEGYDILFETDKRVVRSCINCSKKFYALASEAIPMCHTCKQEPSAAAELAVNNYFIIKESGKKIGPYTLNEIGSMVTDGNVTESDLIETPEKNRQKIFNIPELTPYLKDFYSRGKKTETPARPRTSDDPFLKPRISGKLLLSLTVVLIIGLWLYQIFKAEPVKEIKIEKKPSEEILASWSKKHRNLNDKPETYYRSGLSKIKLHTLEECSGAKDNFIKAFVKSGGQIYILPAVALSMSCIYDFDRNEKDLETALNIADVAINQSPTLAMAYVAKGDIVDEKGQIQDSLRLTEKAVSMAPGDPLVLSYYGKALLATPDGETSGIAAILKSLALDPEITWGHFLIAQAAIKNRRYGLALKHLNRRLEKSPYDTSALYQRASLHLMTRRFGEAKDDLVNAVKSDPENDRARVLYSLLVHRIYGDSDEALRNINISLQKGERLSKTELADCRLLLSSIYLEKARHKEALSEAQAGLLLKPTDSYLKLSRIKAMLFLKNREKAIQLIQEFLLGEFEYPAVVNLYLAEFLEKNRMKSESLDFYSKYAQAEPVAFFPFVKLAMDNLSKGESGNARKILEDGMNKTSFYSLGDFSIDLRAPRFYINVDVLKNSFTKAASSYLNPDFVETVNAILIAQGTEGQSGDRNAQKARAILEKVVKQDQLIQQAFLSLGNIYLRIGKARKALPILLKAREANIENPYPKISLAKAYNELGKTAEAGKELKEISNEGGAGFAALIELAASQFSGKQDEEAQKNLLLAYKARSDYLPLIGKFFNSENP